MVKLLGEQPEIAEFEKTKKEKRTAETIRLYEVVLQSWRKKINTEDSLKFTLKNIEMRSLEINSSISMLPDFGYQTKYEEIFKKLKYIKLLKAQLKL